MKTTIIIFFALLSLGIRAQNSAEAATSDITDVEIQFKNDLENEDLKIYTLGGFYRGNYEDDVVFQKEYNLRYHAFGCTAPPNLSYYESYNLLAFEYLTRTFGNACEEKIRQDAMGLTKWKER